jgi:hypothetical protein
MITAFRSLFTLQLSHEFYGGACPDFRYLVPAATEARLRAGRMIARERDGVLRVLYETDPAGQPRVRLEGETLRFGLRLALPCFANYTTLAEGFPARRLRYTNAAAAGTLADEPPVALVGDLLAYSLTRNGRPATVTLRDAGNVLLATEKVADARSTVTFDLRAVPPGALSLRAAYSNASDTLPVYHDPELLQSGASAIVEVAVDPGFYAAAAPLTIAFATRNDVLRYYVVARNYSDTEFTQLQVKDLGFGDDGRAEIVFSRVASGAFTGAELPPELLAGAGDRVALFRSQAALPRQARPRRRLQLGRQNEVLIANLPHAGADRASADLIVHVSKP